MLTEARSRPYFMWKSKWREEAEVEVCKIYLAEDNRLFDGKDIFLKNSDFEVGTGGTLKDISSEDIRSINISGKYKGLNCINAPSQGKWYYYDIYVHADSWKKIVAREFNSDTTYTSTLANNKWSNWSKSYTAEQKPTLSEIGASPSGHNHDDRYFTEAEINEKLKTKVSVETGKGLSTNDYTTAEKNKLSGIAAGANAYTHPSSHPATIITQDSTHRFVTDTEKSSWNGKASTAVASTTSNGLMSKDMVSKLNGIAPGANAYKHPSTHPATIITEDATHRFVTDVEKASWNSKPAENHNHDDVYSKIGHTHNYLPTNGTAANASKLTGLSPAEMATANTIAKRDGAGDLRCRLLRVEYANQTNISGALAFRTNNTSDNYVRFCSDTNAITTWLGTNKAKYEMLGTATKFDIAMPNPNANFIRCTFSCGNKQELSSLYININGKYVTDWSVGASFSMVVEIMKVHASQYVMSVNLHCAMRNSSETYRLTTSSYKLDYSAIQKITFEHSQAGYKLENCAYTLEWY